METVVVALWAMLPAYVPNNAAVLLGGGRPIDGGRTWQGRRLLGDGKTWRGTLAGTAVGTGLALALNELQPTLAVAAGVGVPVFPLAVAVSLSAGAMVGDIAASFIKRRTGRDRGSAFPVLDQLDFVIAALFATALVAPTWTAEVFTLRRLLVVVVATPVLHLGTNTGAYLLGLKDEPY